MQEDGTIVRSESLIGRQIDAMLDPMDLLEEGGEAVAQAVVKVSETSNLTRRIADFMHGTWLGHPLHPVLTDATIGAWLYSAFFDLASVVTGSKSMEDAADTMCGIGTAMAVPAAVIGLADYSRIPNHAARHGALHGMLNLTGFALYLLSFGARRKGQRGLGMALSAAGLGAATVSAWIGGDMVYRQRVGTNHAVDTGEPEHWTPVLADRDLAEGEAKRIDVIGTPILLTRRNGEVYAIGAVCSHAGGPLEMGKFEDTCVECPWHSSVFDLRDGSIIHGPATSKEPHYDVRIWEGTIELRADPRDQIR